MKLFELVLYQSCNYECVDCPMSRWLYKPDELFENGKKKNAINNHALLKWIDKYLNPNDWFIDITGGEPGLYPEIKKLIPQLNNRGYKGLIRTNGSQSIPSLPSFPRVATWHKGKEFPEFYDFINILQNRDDDWQAKEQHCKDNNIPYILQSYRYYSLPAEERCNEQRFATKPNKLFTEMTTMFASGAIAGCFTGADMGKSLLKMDEPVLYDIRDGCRFCPSVAGVELLLYSIQGFTNVCGITSNMERDTKMIPFIVYPLLTTDNKWVDKQGNVVGVLGDDISLIAQERVYV